MRPARSRASSTRPARSRPSNGEAGREGPGRPAPVAPQREPGVAGPEARLLRAHAGDGEGQPEAARVEQLLLGQPPRRPPRAAAGGRAGPAPPRSRPRSRSPAGPRGWKIARLRVPQPRDERRGDVPGPLPGARLAEARHALPGERPGRVDQRIDGVEAAVGDDPPVREAAAAVEPQQQEEPREGVGPPAERGVVGRRRVEPRLVGLEDARAGRRRRPARGRATRGSAAGREGPRRGSPGRRASGRRPRPRPTPGAGGWIVAVVRSERRMRL